MDPSIINLIMNRGYNTRPPCVPPVKVDQSSYLENVLKYISELLPMKRR